MPRLRKIPVSRQRWIKRLAKTIPFYRHMGLRLTKISHGRSEMKVDIGRQHTLNNGIAHGGVAASIIDSAVGLALYSMLPSRQLITTVELKVNYLRPAGSGLLTATGRIIYKGKRIAVGEAEARDKRARLIAKGLVTYTILGEGRHEIANS